MQPEEVLVALHSAFAIATRAQLRNDALPSAWSQWVILPVPGYIEASSYGPVPLREIDWIELDPIEQRPIGRLVPAQIIDHTHALLQQFAAAGIVVQVMEAKIRLTF